MLTAALQTITSVNGDNLGSFCNFDFFPREWLSAPIEVNHATQQVTQGVQLVAGRTPLRANCLEESIEYREKPKTGRSGPYYEKTLKCVINKDQAISQAIFSTLRYHELVILLYDKNDQVKIVGDQDNGMRLIPELIVEKETEGKSFYDLEFAMESEHPSPFYVV